MSEQHIRHRDPGDAWVRAADGKNYWGRFGAAGLLLFDPARHAILLQHRVSWSDHGGTWGIPGGALHQGERAADGALREAAEESAVPTSAVTPRFVHVLDRGGWSYTTLIAEAVESFEPAVSDAESIEVAWVPVSQVDERDLHPAFAATWKLVRQLATTGHCVVVDAANVVGSVPDGWWKDRAAATKRLRDRLAAVASSGVPAAFTAEPVHGVELSFPQWLMVVEGAARHVEPMEQIQVAVAPGSGDDEIVAQVRQLTQAGNAVVLVTSDAELRCRALDAGAWQVRGARTLLTALG